MCVCVCMYIYIYIYICICIYIHTHTPSNTRTENKKLHKRGKKTIKKTPSEECYLFQSSAQSKPKNSAKNNSPLQTPFPVMRPKV